MFTLPFYEKWRNTRFEGLKKYVNVDLLNVPENSFLELGCGFAENTVKFKEIFTNVTDLNACDGRAEHIKKITVLPDIKSFVFNCEVGRLKQHYNIILHWGLLYHISYPNVLSHFRNVCEKCDYLFLETEVCDSTESCVVTAKEDSTRFDQIKNGGCRMSPAMVEKLLKESNMNFQRIEDSILNVEIHTYDDKIGNTKAFRNGFRKYWICWKADKESPLKETTV